LFTKCKVGGSRILLIKSRYFLTNLYTINMKNTRLIFSGLILFGYLSCQNTLSPDVEDIVEKEHLVIPQKPLEFLSDIRLPEGYKRESVSGYGKWIRNLKLNKDNIVYYYNW